jgi:hypothetical protein
MTLARRASLALVLAAAAAGGCKKQEKRATPAPKVAPMPADEVKRSEDACNAYVTQACACADQVPAVAEQCRLAKALPDAIRIALEVATSPDSGPDVVQQSHASVRKTVAQCIEQTAKLPTLGCP